ncbi:MAG: DUF1801 domain-containing protein [candidate division Zixibacteria bacterium]|nr:DUF1801 domain-containing protein [candidate division Zixibacteria bacterium]
MAELKTKKTTASVGKYISGITDEQQRADCLKLVEIMRKATGAEPKLWGTKIVGFGDFRYKYASGREGDWFQIGFSPRKAEITVYLVCGLKQHSELLKTLGKHKTGGGCLYIKRLEDIHLPTLRKLISTSVKTLKKTLRARMN